MSIFIELWLIVIYSVICKSTMFENRLIRLTSCICPGYTVVYECTIVGGSATVWNGNAFNCSNSHDELILLHPFESGVDHTMMCNDGNIFGRGIKTDTRNIHTSRLYVKVSNNLIGKSIVCTSDSDTQRMRETISTTEDPYPPPEKLSLSSVNLDLRLTVFTWSPISTNCPAIQYKPLASNCGSCPATTNHTTITCIDVPVDGSVCTFAVQSVVCRNIGGNMSDVFHGVLKAIIDHEGYNGATASASVFAVALLLTAAVFISVIIILVIKTKRKIQRILNEQAQRSTVAPRYEEVDFEQQHPKLEFAMSTNKNISYGHCLVPSGSHEEFHVATND